MIPLILVAALAAAPPPPAAQAPPGGPAELGEVAVRQAFEARFGPPPDDLVIGRSGWGRVSLPLRFLSPEALAAQRASEGLVSATQREKAVIAVGPERDGQPIYLHFHGGDPPRSDLWGDPDMVVGLLALADGWFDRCVAGVSTPERCALQLGDLSYYSPVRPDPLGHHPGHMGRCVDIRLFRDDGSRYEALWNRPDDRPSAEGGYSRAITAAFLDYAVESQPITIAYFNDPAVYSVIDGVEPMPGHDDHIHLCW